MMGRYTRRERRSAAMFSGAVVFLLVLVGCSLTSGCGGVAVPSPAEARQTLDGFKAEADQVRADLAAARSTAATQPSSKAAVDAIDKLQSKLDKLEQKVIPAADALVKSYETGKPDATLVALLGQFGPWGSIAGIGLTIGWGVYQRSQAQKNAAALTQVVKSVETAFPDKSPEQKALLATVQDETTKAKVSVIKGD